MWISSDIFIQWNVLGQADSHIKMWRFSDVLGTSPIPFFRVLLLAGRTFDWIRSAQKLQDLYIYITTLTTSWVWCHFVTMLQGICFIYTYMYHVRLTLLTFKLSYFKCHAKFCYNASLNFLRLQIFFSWILKFLWFYIQFEVDLTKVQNRGFTVLFLNTLCNVRWSLPLYRQCYFCLWVEARLQSTYNPEHQNPYFHHCENLKTSLFMKSILMCNV